MKVTAYRTLESNARLQGLEMKTTQWMKTIGLCLAAWAAVAATSAAADPLYPSQLLKDKPPLRAQYEQLIKPIAASHAWTRTAGTETPIQLVKLDDTQYAVLASCKPHDCSSEALVSLMAPSQDHAVGALLVNQGDGAQPAASTLRWLGAPDHRQRQFMAAYLLR